MRINATLEGMRRLQKATMVKVEKIYKNTCGEDLNRLSCKNPSRLGQRLQVR